MNNLMLDTNVLVYAIDVDSKYHHQSLKLLQSKDYNLGTSSKNISELLVVLTRGPKVSINSDEAIDVVSNLTSNMQVLYPNLNSSKIFYELIQKYKPSGLRIHDFEIISIGIENDFREFATFNTKDFKLIEEISLYSF
jgi:predicted nucleic acid-binding protein